MQISKTAVDRAFEAFSLRYVVNAKAVAVEWLLLGPVELPPPGVTV